MADHPTSRLLIQVLRNAGHDVQGAGEIGLAGRGSSIHLTHAIRHQRVCLTTRYRSYRALHNLIGAAQGQHTGILIVRFYNDPARNLTPRGIVRAIGHLEAAGFPMTDQLQVLNDWH